jgi:hypothetical protein
LLPFSSKSFASHLLSENSKINVYKTVILPVVLYGRENWFLTLRKEHRLRVLENRVVRRIFGPKRGEVAGGCRRLHNEELCNVYAFLYKKALTVLRGPLAYPNGLLDLHIETFGRTP